MAHHEPFVTSLDVENLPGKINELSNTTNPKAKVDWAKLTNEDILSYYGKTDIRLSGVYLPK